MFAFCCQTGTGKTALMPPPVAALGLLHTTSVNSAASGIPSLSMVPPQAVTHGSEAGYETWALRSAIPQLDP